MSEKSEAARKKYQAPPFTAGSARTREAARKGQARGVESRKKRKLIREDLEKVLAGKFNMDSEKAHLKELGFNPRTVQEALIMSAVVRDIQSGNSKVLIQYAQLLGELDIPDNGAAKVDAILDEIDQKANDTPVEDGGADNGDT